MAKLKSIFCSERNLVLILSISFLFLSSSVSAEKDSTARSMSWQIRGDYGMVFSTNDLVKGGHYNPDPANQGWTYNPDDEIRNYSSLGIQYQWGLKKDDWRHAAYRNPYFGVGFHVGNFNDERLGNPFSLYFLYGSEFFRFTKWLSWNGELNLGYSSNWNHYDRFTNQDNVAIGGSNNIHVCLATYLRFLLSDHWDLRLGANFTHYSNGALKMPNRGMNMLDPFLSLGYRINEDRDTPRPSFKSTRRPYRLDHDFILTTSCRQVYFNMENTNLKTQYVDYLFHVYAFSYAPMFTRSYKYKFGPSLDFKYDESIGARADYVYNEYDEHYYNRVWLGEKKDRFSMGISLKGEVTMPYFAIFANVGYEFWHKDERIPRVYEQIGVKIQPYGNFFGMMGVRAVYFTKAQYITWSVGYTLKGKEKKE